MTLNESLLIDIIRKDGFYFDDALYHGKEGLADFRKELAKAQVFVAGKEFMADVFEMTKRRPLERFAEIDFVRLRYPSMFIEYRWKDLTVEFIKFFDDMDFTDEERKMLRETRVGVLLRQLGDDGRRFVMETYHRFPHGQQALFANPLIAVCDFTMSDSFDAEAVGFVRTIPLGSSRIGVSDHLTTLQKQVWALLIGREDYDPFKFPCVQYDVGRGSIDDHRKWYQNFVRTGGNLGYYPDVLKDDVELEASWMLHQHVTYYWNPSIADSWIPYMERAMSGLSLYSQKGAETLKKLSNQFFNMMAIEEVIVQAILELLNSKKYAVIKHYDYAERNRERTLRRKPPLTSYHMLKIDHRVKTEYLRINPIGTDTERREKALHSVSGHYRRCGYKNCSGSKHVKGAFHWVMQHERGSAEVGLSVKDYEVI